MTAAIVAKLAVPMLIEALKTGLDRVDHPAARGAADALGALQTAVDAGAVSPEQLVATQTHIEKMAGIEAEMQAKVLESVNASLRAEVASSDPYVRRMRPTFGYMMAFTWGAQMLGIAYVIVTDPVAAGRVLQAMESLGTIWGIALSVLGVYVYQRSAEKKVAAVVAPIENAGKEKPRSPYNE